MQIRVPAWTRERSTRLAMKQLRGATPDGDAAVKSEGVTGGDEMCDREFEGVHWMTLRAYSAIIPVSGEVLAVSAAAAAAAGDDGGSSGP